jgi:hypothetical protein
MAAPPLRTEISDTYPNPSNATARTGFGKLYDYVTTLLGNDGTAAKARTALGLDSMIGNSGAVSGFRNRIINSNFLVNQRAVSGTVTLAAGAYGHDRWKAGAAGCTYTFAALSNGDVAITITAGSLMQVIEGSNVEGGAYTINNRGTAQVRYAGSGGTPTGSYAAVPVTTTSLTGGGNLTVEFTTGTLDKAQVEPGTAATSYERRFYPSELALCRYYAIPVLFTNTFLLWDENASAAGDQHGWNRPLLVYGAMRTTPTLLSPPTITLVNGVSGTFTYQNGMLTYTANSSATGRVYAQVTSATANSILSAEL